MAVSRPFLVEVEKRFMKKQARYYNQILSKTEHKYSKTNTFEIKGLHTYRIMSERKPNIKEKTKQRNAPNYVHNKKKFGFDSNNVIRTSHIPVTTRDYGFMRATNTGTPFPSKREAINPDLLYNTLNNQIDLFLSTSTIGEAASSTLSNSTEDGVDLNMKEKAPKTSKALSFELKRKLFDEAEFTITRGKKTSENIHPRADFKEDITHKESTEFNHKHFEQVCRMMNFNITYGGFT